MHDFTKKFSGELSPRTEKIAKVISLIELPPLVAIPSFALICLCLSDDLGTGIICMLITILTAAVFPIVNIRYFSKKYSNDDKMDVVNREQRTLPLIVGILGYLVGVVLLYLMGAPRLATVLMICYTAVTAAVMIITFYWKISIHSCGIMGPSLGLAAAFWPWGLLYLLLLPPVVWSRYVLKKHTPLQLAMGAVLGAALTLVIFALLL